MEEVEKSIHLAEVKLISKFPLSKRDRDDIFNPQLVLVNLIHLLSAFKGEPCK
jgi:hypothetical protein